MKGWRLIADIGGTNARFARAQVEGGIAGRRDVKVRDFPDFSDALADYLARTGGAEGCAMAAISAAGPVLDGRVQLTNAHWHISEASVSTSIGGAPARILNDLEAVALALPALGREDIAPIGPPCFDRISASRMLAVNVGTGFGAALVVRSGERWTSVPGEAGHMSLGAQSEDELALLGPEFTVEDVISGYGLLALYRKICQRDAMRPSIGDSAGVLAAAATDGTAAEALHRFTVWLARAARNLALASAVWDGVFLVGGVIEGWRRVADLDLFRQEFGAGGKMRLRLSRVPTAIVTRPDPALVGLSQLEIGGN
ncbi:MAG: ROK family protein [Flavobacteriaceae bacterium]